MKNENISARVQTGWTGYNIIAMGGSCVIWMETDAYHCVGILIID